MGKAFEKMPRTTKSFGLGICAIMLAGIYQIGHWIYELVHHLF